MDETTNMILMFLNEWMIMNFLSNPDYDVNGTLFYKALKKYIKSL